MYSVCILRRAVKDIADLPAGQTRLIVEHIDRLAEVPRPPGSKKLRGDSGYSLRVGVYRILYDIDDSNRVVTVYRMKHRRQVFFRTSGSIQQRSIHTPCHPAAISCAARSTSAFGTS